MKLPLYTISGSHYFVFYICSLDGVEGLFLGNVLNAMRGSDSFEKCVRNVNKKSADKTTLGPLPLTSLQISSTTFADLATAELRIKGMQEACGPT